MQNWNNPNLSVFFFVYVESATVLDKQCRLVVNEYSGHLCFHFEFIRTSLYILAAGLYMFFFKQCNSEQHSLEKTIHFYDLNLLVFFALCFLYGKTR